MLKIEKRGGGDRKRGKAVTVLAIKEEDWQKNKV
jgi:hypothetical protein